MYKNNPLEEQNFRNVFVSGKNGKYLITGEIRSKMNDFFYIVEDGHNELIKETKAMVETEDQLWSKFSIHLDIHKKLLPENGNITLYMYAKNKLGGMIHTYPVVLEKFSKEQS
ncbi:hypothetical protein J2Z40_001696 [Cytobacillus eiseniae]|uniref:Uncharacterized protein n=1 Tax=Cytobacillus eiseniae TaxID=762947 RepID=A0ABS4RE03_9BACI|nr:intracellular proteinase inhibitor [Cytobacillus eiseniae]MBP2241134.1 hypothetical protein [Cytobacillus eiseniae]